MQLDVSQQLREGDTCHFLQDRANDVVCNGQLQMLTFRSCVSKEWHTQGNKQDRHSLGFSLCVIAEYMRLLVPGCMPVIDQPDELNV